MMPSASSGERAWDKRRGKLPPRAWRKLPACGRGPNRTREHMAGKLPAPRRDALPACEPTPGRTPKHVASRLPAPRPPAFLLRTLSLCLALSLECSPRAPAEEPQASPDPKPVVAEDFEDWQWIPITHSMMQRGRKALAEGKKLSYEYRGPLFRTLSGFGLPTGRMAEGDDAYDGRSMLLHADYHISVGVHSHKYRDTLAQGREYAYEAALKGKGVFHCQAWFTGMDPRTSKRLLRIRDVLSAKVTETWQVHKGTFRAPTYEEPGLVFREKGTPVFWVAPGDKVYVDSLRIWDKTAAQRPVHK